MSNYLLLQRPIGGIDEVGSAPFNQPDECSRGGRIPSWGKASLNSLRWSESVSQSFCPLERMDLVSGNSEVFDYCVALR